MPKLPLVLVFLSFVSAASAQVICNGLPPLSPTLSTARDDLPPTTTSLMAYGGTRFNGRANITTAPVSISALEEKVWFTVEADNGLPRVFYNRRTRANISSPWYWDYSSSPVVIDRGPSGDSIAVASVMYSATPKYYDYVSTQTYAYLMYLTYQPSICNGHTAGFLYAAFSNDGICWTAPRHANRLGGPTFPCMPDVGNSVPIESAGAIDAGDRLWVIGVEGNAIDVIDGDTTNLLAPPPEECPDNYPGRPCAFINRANQMSRTQTYLGYALVSDPTWIYLASPTELTAAGLANRAFDTSYSPSVDRYASYAYFINLQIAYEAASGYIYISRGYPFPFDRGPQWEGDFLWQSAGWPFNLYGTRTPDPSQTIAVTMWDPQRGSTKVEGCEPNPYTLPNRVQIYRMYIGTLTNISNIASSAASWSLVTDVGNQYGYPSMNLNYIWSAGTPLVAADQTNIGRDVAFGSFLRDGAGNIVRDGGSIVWLAGDSKMLSKSVGPCRITGMERITQFTLP